MSAVYSSSLLEKISHSLCPIGDYGFYPEQAGYVKSSSKFVSRKVLHQQRNAQILYLYFNCRKIKESKFSKIFSTEMPFIKIEVVLMYYIRTQKITNSLIYNYIIPFIKSPDRPETARTLRVIEAAIRDIIGHASEGIDPEKFYGELKDYMGEQEVKLLCNKFPLKEKINGI